MKMALPILTLTLVLFSGTVYSQQADSVKAEPDHKPLSTHIAGMTESGEVSLSQVKRTRGIYVTEYDADERWQVLSYSLRFEHGERTSECSSKGANYSNNCKAYIDALQVGNTVEVFDVKVQRKSGDIVEAPSIKLNISEK